MRRLLINTLAVFLATAILCIGSVEASVFLKGEEAVPAINCTLTSRRQAVVENVGIEEEEEQKYPARDLELLARLVRAEAEGEPFAGKVAVAASVLHRVESNLYPNTIPGVVYQVVNGCYQYSPVLDGRIMKPANEEAWRAVKAALAGEDPSRGASGFYNPAKTRNRWVRSRPVTAVIGEHVFFK